MNWTTRASIFGTVAIVSIAIAQSASASFVIFVEGNDTATLQRVRTISPSAFTTKINGQPAIQAGIFNSENSADSLAITLQQSGLSAQKYFRTSGGKETDVQVPFPETTTSSVFSAPSPQQVVIQPSSVVQTLPQPSSFQVESQSQIFSSAPQQVATYSNQYQQITTNTVIPQVQTQQVLVPRWQQVLVPETRQFVTQTVVPQTQIVQTSVPSGYVQPTGYTNQIQATGFVQPTGFVQSTGYVQQPTGYVQSSGFSQAVNYVQPQTGFIPSSTVVTTPYNNSVATNFTATQSQPIAANSFSNGFSSEFSNTTQLNQQVSQPAQISDFRYVTVVPTPANNQLLLSQVRQYVPSAFFSSSGRGSFIHAGAYQNRDSAEAVSRYLRSQGVDSRVLYF
ncbi:hypothetical protein [Pseudanabaena mucicola]|uniref:SPOR domain-containing protein n=1 Tax=Pseudanabaena mucicola FACHB-723 TaxID=2692860 RepID=A0ABR7ZW54_9CYAN|nr:hypothetical protein [Pseudanabaena mucicola]MBD2188201.1 hypothetical protein [Pseudanabaena mucicola FACHB-723]